MFDFWNRRSAERAARPRRRAVRGPITIGFEQLEGREMLSSGLVLDIGPSEAPPMPRPLIGHFNPEADARVAVATRAKLDPVARPWSRGGRFRFG